MSEHALLGWGILVLASALDLYGLLFISWSARENLRNAKINEENARINVENARKLERWMLWKVNKRDADRGINAPGAIIYDEDPGESVVVRAAPHLLDLLERARAATVFHTSQAQPQPAPTEEKAHDEND